MQLTKYDFINDFIDNYLNNLSSLPFMVIAILGLMVFVMILIIMLFLFKDCEKSYKWMNDLYLSTVWSGIIQTILQSYLIITVLFA